MSEQLPTLPGDWERRLAAEVVTPLEADQSAVIVAAATAATTGGAAIVTLTMAGAAKVTAAALLVITIGGAIAAATGILPDPLQNWVADLVDGIGLHFPRPEEVVTTVPTIPGVTIPGVTVTLP